MGDIKELNGKNELDDLSPNFLWAIGRVATHGNTKYYRGNWQAGTKGDYVAALFRHLLKYMAGQVYDTETGQHHMAHIARNAEIVHWHDEGPTINDRPCLCPHCHPTSGHSTATTMGE